MAETNTTRDVPEQLSGHLDEQANKARTVSALLECITPVVDGITGECASDADAAGMSLRVVKRLVDEIAEGLDCVVLRRVIEGKAS